MLIGDRQKSLTVRLSDGLRSARRGGLAVSEKLRKSRCSAGEGSGEDGPEEGRETVAVRLCVRPRGDVVHGDACQREIGAGWGCPASLLL